MSSKVRVQGKIMNRDVKHHVKTFKSINNHINGDGSVKYNVKN